MDYKPSLLITQSFVVSAAGTYWDYRDYIFCLVSNLSVKDVAIRLNIERGTEFSPELRSAAKASGFSNIELTTIQPESWASYMLEQIKLNPSKWVMPWPGDHIYVHPDDDAFVKSLAAAESLGADAVAYSHVQDFEYMLDWNRVKVLVNTPEYVLIEWGEGCRYYQNLKLQLMTKKRIRASLIMPPVPGFVIYKADLFKKILQALPEKTTRWQDMEYSEAKAVWSFKLLIPKQALYRHVHGYWYEGFLKYLSGGNFPKEVRAEIETWYIKPNYNWQENKPDREAYRKMCLKQHPYFEKYFAIRKPNEFKNDFGSSPFDANWKKPNEFLFLTNNFFKLVVNDFPRRVTRNLIKVLK